MAHSKETREYLEFISRSIRKNVLFRMSEVETFRDCRLKEVTDLATEIAYYATKEIAEYDAS